MNKNNDIYIFLSLCLLISDRARPQTVSTTTRVDNFAEASVRVTSSQNDFYICSPKYEVISEYERIRIRIRMRITKKADSDAKTDQSDPKTEKSETSLPVAYLHLRTVKMTATCPPDYTAKDVIGKCAKAFSALDEEDFSTVVPATNRRSGVHYANRYCAACHNDSAVELWDLTISWAALYGETPFAGDAKKKKKRKKTEQEIARTLRYDETLKKYVVDDEGTRLECALGAAKPANLSTNLCPLKFVWECPAVARSDSPTDCLGFAGPSVCTRSNHVFANARCARCNHYADDALRPCGDIWQPTLRTKSNAAQTLFQLRKSPNGDSCAIPAVAKYYC